MSYIAMSSIRKGGAATSGFITRFDRHQRCWVWREQWPDPKHKRLKHVICGTGYRTRSEANAGIKQEVERRKAIEAERAAKGVRSVRKKAEPKFEKVRQPIASAVASTARRVADS